MTVPQFPSCQGGVPRASEAGWSFPSCQGGVPRASGAGWCSLPPASFASRRQPRTSRFVSRPMNQFNNLRTFKARRRELRRNLTPAEARLWSHLQGKQLHGRKFRRQHSIGPYVLDFYCPARRLAVELDGAAHDHEDAQQHDARRTAFLASLGITLLRFENREVFENAEGVLLEISRYLDEKSVTTPALRATPPRRGGES